MKNIFSILFACFALTLVAEEKPVDENAGNYGRTSTPSYVADEPVFEEEEEASYCAGCDEEQTEQEEVTSYVCGEEDKDDECGCDECDHTRFACGEEKEGTDAFYACGCGDKKKGGMDASFFRWKRYKTNFGMEKIFVRFPQRPAISKSNTLLTAYAYDHAVMYSFCGYYPPLGNVDAGLWFDDILDNVSNYPYTLINHTVFQSTAGDWVMDYVVHDYVQNLVLKSRAVVTPFNGYILQCVKPMGAKDHFPYYLDNFMLKCECDY